MHSSLTVHPALRPGFSSPDELWKEILKHIRYTLGQSRVDLSPKGMLRPLALAIRDRLIDGMLETEERYRTTGSKRLYYLSMEFLMGRVLSDNVCNLQLTTLCRETCELRNGARCCSECIDCRQFLVVGGDHGGEPSHQRCLMA